MKTLLKLMNKDILIGKKIFLVLLFLFLSLLNSLPSFSLDEIHKNLVKVDEVPINFKAYHPKDEEYHVETYDLLTISLEYESGEKDFYSNLGILPNGNITLPKFGEVKVEDKTVTEIRELLYSTHENLKSVEIIVSHESGKVTVIGQVRNPGAYSIKDINTVYDAIGAAGGFSVIANKKQVEVIKQHQDGTRIMYTINFPKEVYKAFGTNSGIGKERYKVNEGDIVYVHTQKSKAFAMWILRALEVATVGIVSGVIVAAFQ